MWRRAHGAVGRCGINAVLAHGYIHVFGGEGEDTASGVFSDHDVYNPASDSWISLRPMPVPVHGVTGASFIDGVIHLTGGGIMDGGDNGTTLHQVFRPRGKLKQNSARVKLGFTVGWHVEAEPPPSCHTSTHRASLECSLLRWHSQLRFSR